MGSPPAKVAAPPQEAPTAPQGDSFADVAERFLDRHVKPQRQAKETERVIRRHLVARWHDRPLADIKRRDVIAMVEEIVDAGTPAMARQVLGRAKTLFGWAVARDMIEYSPADRVNAKDLIGRKKARQRVLSDSEIAAVWRASERLGYPFGPLVRLLMLTGVRRSEAAKARWSEFDLERRLWTIPPERFKSDAMHLVPLSDDAIAVLAELPRFEQGDYLFSTTSGRKPVGGFSKAKARLDMMVAAELGAAPADWVNHDLRRTLRTRLSALRIPTEVAERVIGHGSKGLARVYDQHRYLDEMREALEAWAGLLRWILTPTTPDVVRMRRHE